MQVQRFRDTRTNEIVTQVPISEIAHFEEFDGPTLWVCDECGSSDLHTTAWVDLNTDKLRNDEPPTNQVWCQKCDEKHGDGERGWYGVHEIAKPAGPDCGHSACSQNYIDTGETGCIEDAEDCNIGLFGGGAA